MIMMIIIIMVINASYHNPVCRAWQLHAQENLQQIKVHPKIGPCTRTLYVLRLDIGSPGVSYDLKQLGALERIRCARRATPNFYLARVRSHRVLPCSTDWTIITTDKQFFTYSGSCNEVQRFLCIFQSFCLSYSQVSEQICLCL